MSIKSGLAQLQPYAGKSEMDFVNAFGRKPVSISEMAFGNRLLQWQEKTFGGQIRSVAVLFHSTHRFVRITNRYQV